MEFGAALAKLEGEAIRGLDIDVPGLLACLAPVEVGGEIGLARP